MVAQLLLALSLLGASPTSSNGGDSFEESLRFAVLGHIRGGPGNGVIPRERLRETIDEINRTEPELVFVLGDMIYGSWHQDPIAEEIHADWDAIDAELARLDAPVYRIPGNHDAWEPVTRDIWLERYGPMYSSLRQGEVLFLLLRSGWIPAQGDDSWCPGAYTRGAPLEAEQIQFVKDELEAAAGAHHVFVMMHHMLWWEQPDSWWSDVHPLLAAAPTRAVFAGDLGPWKFSHEERDGIQYLQTTVEYTTPPLEMMRNREESRAISSQLDNFLLVEVSGPDVRYEVRTVGALSTGRFSPTLWKEIHEYDKGTVRRRLFDKLGTPERMFKGLAAVGGAGFVGGALAMLLLLALLKLRGDTA